MFSLTDIPICENGGAAGPGREAVSDIWENAACVAAVTAGTSDGGRSAADWTAEVRPVGATDECVGAGCAAATVRPDAATPTASSDGTPAAAAADDVACAIPRMGARSDVCQRSCHAVSTSLGTTGYSRWLGGSQCPTATAVASCWQASRLISAATASKSGWPSPARCS